MKTLYTSRIEYADVDSSMQVRLSNLQSLLLKASDDSVAKSGLSTNYLREQYNSAWILLSMSVIMNELPRYYATIEIETWESGIAHYIIRREYIIYSYDGQQRIRIGQGTSSWTILHLGSRHISKGVFNDPLWKNNSFYESIGIKRIKFDADLKFNELTTYKIKYTDVDFNNHLNSCSYLQYFLNTDNSLAKITPIRFDIIYNKEVLNNENIRIGVHNEGDKIEYILLTEDLQLTCQATIQKIY